MTRHRDGSGMNDSNQIDATVDVRLGDIDAFGTPELHVSYTSVVYSLLPSAKHLSNFGIDHSIAVSLLAGQIIECALKSYLARNNFNTTQLKNRATGHSIAYLWNAVSEIEHSPLDKAIPTCIETLATLHDKPFFLRYQEKVNVVVTPNPRVLIDTVESIVQKLCPRSPV